MVELLDETGGPLMSLDADQAMDRRRLKRRLTVWRIAAVVAEGAPFDGVGFLVHPRARAPDG